MELSRDFLLRTASQCVQRRIGWSVDCHMVSLQMSIFLNLNKHVAGSKMAQIQRKRENVSQTYPNWRLRLDRKEQWHE